MPALTSSVDESNKLSLNYIHHCTSKGTSGFDAIVVQ